MSARIKIAGLVLSVFMLGHVSAQEFYNSVNPLTTKSNTLNYKLTGKQYYFLSTLNGTVYFNDNWVSGKLKLENGDRYDSVYIKLNTFLEDLVAYNERTGAVFVVDKSIIDEFEMEFEKGQKFLFRKVVFDRAPKGEHYLNVLYDGRVKLYAWHRTLEVQTSTYKDNYGLLRDSEFRAEIVYWLVFPDNSIHRVAMKRRSFLQLFPEQKRTLRRSFRKNRVYFYTPEHLVQAARILEQEMF